MAFCTWLVQNKIISLVFHTCKQFIHRSTKPVNILKKCMFVPDILKKYFQMKTFRKYYPRRVPRKSNLAFSNVKGAVWVN